MPQIYPGDQTFLFFSPDNYELKNKAYDLVQHQKA